MSINATSRDEQPQRDIDRIIAAAKQQMPEVRVWQWPKKHPGDDDGIWWFSLPGMPQDIQVESASGNCPFVVETDEQSSYNARRANTVEEVETWIIEYLSLQRDAGQS